MIENGSRDFKGNSEEQQPEQVQLVIVIPTKNRRALLERALESVRVQSYEAYRIVVINDGSTDGTQEYLDLLQDSENDPWLTGRLQVIHHAKSRGVNAARNAAFKTLKEGEWAVQLDDDDMLLPNALTTIAEAITKIPSRIQILCFNAITRTTKEEFVSGRNFKEGEIYFDPTYTDFMMGIDAHGDTRVVLKWTLFPKYFFAEDINGFEGEWWKLVGRDNAGVRYLPEQTTLIDQSHGQEQLSNIAARQNPASFVRAYRRMFKTHAQFYSDYPHEALSGEISAIKLAIRAFDIPSELYFFWLYLKSFFQIIFRAKRPKEKQHS